MANEVHDLDLDQHMQLIVLSTRNDWVRCRPVGGDRIIMLEASLLVDVVPGDIATVRPRRQWNGDGHSYLTATYESVRLDVAALGLVPLGLEHRDVWAPGQDLWGADRHVFEDLARPLVACGPRQGYVMEHVVPGRDPDLELDPVTASLELEEAGEESTARDFLMAVCEEDLRCLDAHAHLGAYALEDVLEIAIRHYEVGVRIGELSVRPDFDGVLPWGHLGNRPFLRCMHGYGLCLWRHGRFEDAGRVFERLLRLNPNDNQGARFLIREVRRQTPWEESELC
jgi:hypothetical protein